MNSQAHATVVVACAANGCYALPLAVMLRSLVANLSPHYRVEVYAVDDEVDPADKEKVLESLNGRVTLHWVPVRQSALSGLPTWGRMAMTTYQKLTLVEWLPAGTEKALWLDCDLLVLGDVARLWNSDLGDHHILSAPDPRVPLVSSPGGVAGYRELGLPAGAGHFNAGVLLIDVARWRADDVGGRAIKYLQNYRDKVFYFDQEGLNAVLAGKWGELDHRWNWHPTALGRNGVDPLSPDTAWIVHYSGRLKPWSYSGSNPHHEIYRRYLDQTAWRGWRPKRDWRSMLLNAYELSSLRRWLHPAEQWAMRLDRASTRRYYRS